MNQQDPFAGLGDDDATVLVPRPGGLPIPGSGPTPEAPQPNTALPAQPRGTAPGESAGGTAAIAETAGLNPLERAATHLLGLIPKLRGMVSHPDPEALRQQVIRDIQTFEQRLQRAGIDPKTLLRARYVLCTAIDEAVLNTPWGNAGSWNQYSLLVTFHNEAGGGEKFFQLLNLLLQDPATHIDLLELMYLCLALGFQGRYGVRQGGREQLEQLKDNLYRTIRTQRGDHERDLSPHWRGVEDSRKSLVRFVPAWVFGAVAALLLVGTFMVFDFRLNAYSDPVLGALSRVDAAVTVPNLPRRALPPPPAPPPPASAPAPPPPLTLTELLADDIREQRIEVEEDPRRAHVRVLGSALFASGRATIAPAQIPLFQRIAAALKQIPGPVLVTGHTDSIPIRRSLRFSSNWALSKARAETVAKLLGRETGQPQRISAEGRADTEPLPGLAGSDGRNRRVEIYLIKTPVHRP